MGIHGRHVHQHHRKSDPLRKTRRIDRGKCVTWSALEETVLHRLWQSSTSSTMVSAQDAWLKGLSLRRQCYQRPRAAFSVRQRKVAQESRRTASHIRLLLGARQGTYTGQQWKTTTPPPVHQGNMSWMSGIYIFDGSGGGHSQDPRLRRVGWCTACLERRRLEGSLLLQCRFATNRSASRTHDARRACGKDRCTRSQLTQHLLTSVARRERETRWRNGTTVKNSVEAKRDA